MTEIDQLSSSSSNTLCLSWERFVCKIFDDHAIGADKLVYADNTIIISIKDKFCLSKALNQHPEITKLHLSNIKFIPSDLSWLFSNLKFIVSIKFENFIFSSQTSLKCWFNECEKLKSAHFGFGFTLKDVETVEFMFLNCRELVRVHCPHFTTDDVKCMKSMFYNCLKLKDISISHWDTSKVESFECMFFNCYGLDYIDISNWKLKKCSSFKAMFFRCLNLKSIDCENLFISNGARMDYMFCDCKVLETVNNAGWKFEKPVNAAHMFDSCCKLKEIVGKINTNMKDGMFKDCSESFATSV